MSACNYDAGDSFYNGYDASICNIICNERKNYVPPWTREYATFPTNYDGKSKFVICPDRDEKRKQQILYKTKVLENKSEYNKKLTKKQQYANLVNGKANYLTNNSTYSTQNQYITIPNTSRLIPNQKNPNILFACPVGKKKITGPTIFSGNNNTMWKR